MTSPGLSADADARAAVRHLAATLAYRATKVLRDPPAGFATAAFDAQSPGTPERRSSVSPGTPERRSSTTRLPVQIVAHMADLMAWGVTLARGEYVWKAEGSDDWDVEVQRFFTNLEAMDRELSGSAFSGSLDKLIQGPLADALTHVGQLAMLRGMAGGPVKPESYARAEIVIGRVGPEQASPGREFDGDASARS